MKTRLTHLFSTAAVGLCLLATACTGEDDKSGLQQVASFDHQVTGVAVSKDNRIFVSFPRWSEDAPISVGEWTGGQVKPYPDADWNAWRKDKTGLDPAEHFVCVQSVVFDHHNNLWVVDAGSINAEHTVPGAAKLVKISLKGEDVQIIQFDEKEAPVGSYLNDVRFSTDDHFAFLTDSGKGAIVVVDTITGDTRRLLENDVSTMAEKNIVPHADGKELRRPDGRKLNINSDGIAMSADGKYLYWQALTGKTLYRIPTGALIDDSLTPKQVKAQVERVGEGNVADGLWMDKQDRLYVTAPEENAVKVRNGAAVSTVVQDPRLRWPDTFAEGSDGTIYVTTSHIQDSAWFDPKAGEAVKTELWKLKATQPAEK